MKVTVFSSNQPRHLNLVKELSKIVENVYFISEVNTVFPGKVNDFFKKTDVMQKYFYKVMNSEVKIFKNINFLPFNVRTLLIKSGDLNMLPKQILADSLDSDLYIIFGSSFIKGWLVDYLIEKRAINIHMGLSPYYRGSSCNFWAAYEENFHLIGATIHLLSKGLDSGNILYHVLPTFHNCRNCFEFSMNAVKVAHDSIIENIKMQRLFEFDSVIQNNEKEIKYSKNINFNDKTAINFLENEPSIEYIKKKIDYDFNDKLYINRYVPNNN